MDSQDKGMCGRSDYDYNNYEVYDDGFGDILNILDFSGESLEGDGGLVDDWTSNLGPIPPEVFGEMLSPVSGVSDGNGGGGGGGSSAYLLASSGDNVETCEPKCRPIVKEPFKSQFKPQPPTFIEEKKLYTMPRSFEAPSPDSVLERRSSSSTTKTSFFKPNLKIPVRARTKRSTKRSNTNPWLRLPLPIPCQKKKKKRRNFCQQPDNEIKKCSHCEITKTPQWREGPMGPKTLCNACGVRYRSGRLFPEYRPAASPTFIPSLHSNSHRKVIEMRRKGATMNDNYFVKNCLSSNSTHNRLCS